MAIPLRRRDPEPMHGFGKMYYPIGFCFFKDTPDESGLPGRKVTCQHGKTLTFKTARKILGLPSWDGDEKCKEESAQPVAVNAES